MKNVKDHGNAFVIASCLYPAVLNRERKQWELLKKALPLKRQPAWSECFRRRNAYIVGTEATRDCRLRKVVGFDVDLLNAIAEDQALKSSILTRLCRPHPIQTETLTSLLQAQLPRATGSRFQRALYYRTINNEEIQVLMIFRARP